MISFQKFFILFFIYISVDSKHSLFVINPNEKLILWESAPTKPPGTLLALAVLTKFYTKSYVPRYPIDAEFDLKHDYNAKLSQYNLNLDKDNLIIHTVIWNMVKFSKYFKGKTFASINFRGYKLSRMPRGKITFRGDKLSRMTLFRNFAGINFRGQGIFHPDSFIFVHFFINFRTKKIADHCLKRFAGINFREWSFNRTFAGINFRE